MTALDALAVAEFAHARGDRPDLTGVDLHEADLRRANLLDARLNGANLGGADLRAATLVRADLRDANLRFADLFEANLSWADLRGADLGGAELTGANFNGALIPEGWTIRSWTGAGSMHRMTTLAVYPGGHTVFSGCFRGSIDTFADRVESTHYDNPLPLDDYRAIVADMRRILARDYRPD